MKTKLELSREKKMVAAQVRQVKRDKIWFDRRCRLMRQIWADAGGEA